MRSLAVLLLLTNALFFGWSGGWLDGVAGVPAHGDREPGRLARQVRPEAIRVLPASTAASAGPTDAAPEPLQPDATATPAAAASAALPAASAGASVVTNRALAAASTATAPGAPVIPATAITAVASITPAVAAPAVAVASADTSNTRTAVAPAAPAGVASTAADAGLAALAGRQTLATRPVGATAGVFVAPACLQAGPFSPAEVDAAQAALKAALPALRWAEATQPPRGGWMVYMGRFADRDAQQRKADELRRIAVVFEEIGPPPAAGPGLALGRYASRSAADAALAQFARRGIRTARVVESGPPEVAQLLRVDRADAQTAATVGALRLPALLGRGFSACPPSG